MATPVVLTPDNTAAYAGGGASPAAGTGSADGGSRYGSTAGAAVGSAAGAAAGTPGSAGGAGGSGAALGQGAAPAARAGLTLSKDTADAANVRSFVSAAGSLTGRRLRQVGAPARAPRLHRRLQRRASRVAAPCPLYTRHACDCAATLCTRAACHFTDGACLRQADIPVTSVPGAAVGGLLPASQGAAHLAAAPVLGSAASPATGSAAARGGAAGTQSAGQGAAQAAQVPASRSAAAADYGTAAAGQGAASGQPAAQGAAQGAGASALGGMTPNAARARATPATAQDLADLQVPQAPSCRPGHTDQQTGHATCLLWKSIGPFHLGLGSEHLGGGDAQPPGRKAGRSLVVLPWQACRAAIYRRLRLILLLATRSRAGAGPAQRPAQRRREPALRAGGRGERDRGGRARGRGGARRARLCARPRRGRRRGRHAGRRHRGARRALGRRVCEPGRHEPARRAGAGRARGALLRARAVPQRGSAGGAPQRICSPCHARDGGTGLRARQVPVQPLVSLINDLAATGSATAAALPQPGPRPPLPPGAASLLATGVPARRAPGEDPYPGGAQNSGSAAGDAALAPVNLSQAAAGSGGPANAFSWQEGRKRAR